MDNVIMDNLFCAMINSLSTAFISKEIISHSIILIKN